MPEVNPLILTVKPFVSEVVFFHSDSMPPLFSAHIIIQLSITGESHSLITDSNSCTSWRKQKIRHIKWQSIGLAGYFCTLLIREKNVTYIPEYFQ